jgi:hypothetical protein
LGLRRGESVHKFVPGVVLAALLEFRDVEQDDVGIGVFGSVFFEDSESNVRGIVRAPVRDAKELTGKSPRLEGPEQRLIEDRPQHCANGGFLVPGDYADGCVDLPARSLLSRCKSFRQHDA